MKRFILSAAIALWCAPVQSAAPIRATSSFDFFSRYVSDAATFEDLRAEARAELKPNDPKDTVMNCIHSGTAFDLEMAAAIRRMRGMKLATGLAETDEVPQDIASIYELRRAAMAKLTSLCTTMAEGPKPGVDYAAVAAEMPKLRAQLEYLDKTEYQASPLVFATLLSNRPDSQNHMSHMVITRDQRKRLLDQIEIAFGDKLKDEHAIYAVAEMQLFRDKLIEFKCADDPW
jgi:hypothetical protein